MQYSINMIWPFYLTRTANHGVNQEFILGVPKFPEQRDVRMRDPRIAYLEFKRRTGKETDSTTYNSFLFDNRHLFPMRRKSGSL